MGKIRHHVIISGTGRAGTTFLVQLLTHLGLDTGYEAGNTAVPEVERAGLERNIFSADAPHIIKNPRLSDQISEVLSNPDIRIDHAILPVRAFEAAAASRAYVQKQATGRSDIKGGVIDRINRAMRFRSASPAPRPAWGGLWHAGRAAEQEAILRSKFTKLVEELVRHDVPISMLWFPRLVRDPDYLYEKLAFLLTEHDLTSFRTVFDRVRDVGLVHQFTPNDN